MGLNFLHVFSGSNLKLRIIMPNRSRSQSSMNVGYLCIIGDSLSNGKAHSYFIVIESKCLQSKCLQINEMQRDLPHICIYRMYTYILFLIQSYHLKYVWYCKVKRLLLMYFSLWGPAPHELLAITILKASYLCSCVFPLTCQWDNWISE